MNKISLVLILLPSCSSVFPIPVNPAFYFSQTIPKVLPNVESLDLSNKNSWKFVIFWNSSPYTAGSYYEPSNFGWSDFSHAEKQQFSNLFDKCSVDYYHDLGTMPYIIFPSTEMGFLEVTINENLLISFGENVIETHTRIISNGKSIKDGFFVRKIKFHEIQFRNAILNYAIKRKKIRASQPI